jgi:hypothetical protein
MLQAAGGQCESQSEAFRGALPAGLYDVCQATAEEALAGAAASVTVAGLRYNPEYTGDYSLQQSPLNGRPHWAQPGDGGHHLYWTPNFSLFGSSAWLLDKLTLTRSHGPRQRSLFAGVDGRRPTVWSAQPVYDVYR